MSDHLRQDVGEHDMEIRVGDVTLPGFLSIPSGARGIVVFCHGSGSSRHSTRNRFVAEGLRDRAMGTLLFDLLTQEEGEDRQLVFDITMLADRVLGVLEWLRSRSDTRGLRVGLFGASTGAAAALVAEARSAGASAIVSRGGRPDLAGEALELIQTPTLLIVGSEDHDCIPLNQAAFERLMCEKRLEIVEGATHLFEESGTLAHAASLAADWFDAHFGGGEEGGVDVSGS